VIAVCDRPAGRDASRPLPRAVRGVIMAGMSPKFAKIGLSVVVLGAAFFLLFRSSLAEGTSYYKHVDEVMAAPEAWYGKQLKLHGFVAKDSIRRKRESLDYRFVVHSKGHRVQASYSGIVPDTFKDDAEVVLTGRLGPQGFEVEPDGVMAKCPSKYDASPNAPVKAPGHAKPAVTAS
jgi:cytochrome c-type biogenesis protein CcmE